MPDGTSGAWTFVMRFLVLFAPFACLACSADDVPSGAAESTTEVAATPDAGDSGESGIPFTSYGAADFESFHWSWYGTGPHGAFDLNADCGVTSEGTLSYSDPSIDAAGTATETECDDFKGYVVSAPYLGALVAPGDACSNATDDYVTAKVVIRDGGTFSTTGSCRGGAFAGAESRMRALREKYAIKADGGTD
jgi:hypothetical protein